MALISCRVCSNMVADDAPNCTKCGTPDPSGGKAKSIFLKRIFGVTIIVIALGILWTVVIPNIEKNWLLPKPVHQ